MNDYIDFAIEKQVNLDRSGDILKADFTSKLRGGEEDSNSKHQRNRSEFTTSIILEQEALANTC